MSMLGETYVTLSAMITPALFMTACASLIISTSNRMSRIVDRVRVQIELADRLDRGIVEVDYPELRRRGRMRNCGRWNGGPDGCDSP